MKVTAQEFKVTVYMTDDEDPKGALQDALVDAIDVTNGMYDYRLTAVGGTREVEVDEDTGYLVGE